MTSSSHGGTVSREPSWLTEVHRQLPQRRRYIVDCVRERWSVLPGHGSLLPGHTVLRSSCEVGRSQLATGSNCRRRDHIFRDRSDRQHDPRRQRCLVLPAVHHRLSRLDRPRALPLRPRPLGRCSETPPTTLAQSQLPHSSTRRRSGNRRRTAAVSLPRS
jgi:hypothetical protein